MALSPPPYQSEDGAAPPPTYPREADPVEQAFDEQQQASTSTVPLPTADPLPSYWLQTSHAPSSSQGVFDGSSMDHSGEWQDEVDFAIIGSGITGVSAAYHLAHQLPASAGPSASLRRIALYEARDFCSGATGRNGGHLTASSVLAYSDLASNPSHLARFMGAHPSDHWGSDKGTVTDETIRRMLTLESRTVAELLMIVRMDALRAKKRKAAAAAAGNASTSEADPSEQDPELVFGANWHICETPEEVDGFSDSIEAAKRAGLSDFALQVRRVPETEWKAKLREPSGVSGVFEIPGGTVHPRRLVGLLWRAARAEASKRQIALHTWTNTPVTEVQSSSHNFGNVLQTRRGPVRAKYVIHATNGYAAHLLSSSHRDPQKCIIPTRGQCIAVKPTSSPNEGEPLWTMGFSLNSGYEYLQQRPASNPGETPPCILGGGRQSAKGFEWNVADDSKTDDNVHTYLDQLLPKMFPANFEQSKSKADLEWTGIMGFTKSKDPLVGPVVGGQDDEGQLPGQYISAGYSGHGMPRAFSCAEVVVDMIMAEERRQQWQPPVW